jgi:ATP-dependent helicase/DNAse subunit B
MFAAVESTYSELVGMGFTPYFPAVSRTSAAGLDHARRFLFATDSVPIAADGAVEFVSSPSREKEMTVIAAKIKNLLLTGAYRPEQVAVVVRDTGIYKDFRNICGEFGIPVSLPREEQLKDQPLVRMLTNVCAARMTNGARHAVINLMNSPALTLTTWSSGLSTMLFGHGMIGLACSSGGLAVRKIPPAGPVLTGCVIWWAGCRNRAPAAG